MIIKVCGMTDPDNIKDLNQLPISFMGMIFYPESSRYADNLTWNDIKNNIHPAIERVGVFVNAEMDEIMEITNRVYLDLIQLHGDESPEFSEELNDTIPVIKAFSISEISDFEKTKEYEGKVSYFLFDTKTPLYGGSGQKFDWSILEAYKGNTPFLLSGGIGPEDVENIKLIQHPKFCGIDLNSKFETKPGFKNIEQLKQFIKDLRDE
ncbi:MAG: phosphoribosylanthranilate isomerase [Dysgonomonas sp.]|nr:phosphoribosylanthranilate isomerase [Dysgonomonas sp.]